MTRGPWGHVGAQGGSFGSLYLPCGRPREVTSNFPVTQSTDVAPMYLRHCPEMKEASLVLTETGTEGKRVNEYQEEETHHEGRAKCHRSRGDSPHPGRELSSAAWSIEPNLSLRGRQAVRVQRPRGGKLHVGRKRKHTKTLVTKWPWRPGLPLGIPEGKENIAEWCLF